MGRLSVVVQKPFLGKILSTVETDERPLAGVNPVVDVEVRLPSVGLRADGADEGFFAGVLSFMLNLKI